MGRFFSLRFSRLAPRYGPHYGIAAQGFLRGLGLVFVLSFWSFAAQAVPLSGPHGLLPAAANTLLLSVCGLGALFGLGLLYGFFPWFACLGASVAYGFLLWVAGPWLSLPGDVLLLEMAIPGLILVPPLKRSYPSLAHQSSRLTGIIWLNLILCKVLLGSGLAQMMSPDPSWRDSTALYRFFETQSLPTVPGWYFHQLPATILDYGLWGLIFIEIMLPAYVVLPRTFRNILAGGTALVAVILLAAGHHGFLPLQMILLAFTLVDDVSWRQVLPSHWGPAASTSVYRPSLPAKILLTLMIPLLLFQALPSPRFPGEAILNALHLSNRITLFERVPETRFELSLQGSRDGRQWVEYRFDVKPTDPRYLPPLSFLHHPRLDEQFVVLARQLGHSGSGADAPPPAWLLRLIARLFSGDPTVQHLFPVNPFPGEPPRLLRLVLYEYRFSDPATRRDEQVWWIRKPLMQYGPVFTRQGIPPRSAPPQPE